MTKCHQKPLLNPQKHKSINKHRHQKHKTYTNKPKISARTQIKTQKTIKTHRTQHKKYIKIVQKMQTKITERTKTQKP